MEQTTSSEEALYYKDKHILETNPKLVSRDPIDKNTAVALLGVNPVNYDKILREQESKNKASKVFSLEDQAKRFNDIQPLFYDQAQIWWLWDSNEFKWQMVDEVDILNMINDSTGKDVISSKSRAEILNALKQLGRKNLPKPIKESWIQFHDLIIDAQTGEEFKASPEYFVTNPIPWQLSNPRYIETPTMDKIFAEWVGKENIKLLYQIIAYSLLPSYPIHRLFCLIGEGMNGKSCFLRLLCKFLGQNNTTSTELDTLIKSRFEVTRLYKKLVCIMGETNFNEITQTSILKKLTGQDPIGFEYKNKNPFEAVNYAKILIATNNLPTTTDKTDGFYRRWTIIDFPNQFSEEKDILGTIPDEEYRILGVKVLFVLKDLLEERKFHNEGSVQDRAEKYEAKSDFLTKFIKECVVEDPNEFITKADFYKKFTQWCKINRHRELNETAVGINLKKKGFEENKRYFNWLYDGKGGQARVWEGVKWKD